MAFDVNQLDAETTPMRWRIVSKWMHETGQDLSQLDAEYAAALERAEEFAGDVETGTGNQPGVGSEPEPTRVTGVTIGGGDAQDIEEGGTLQLSATVAPAGADDQRVTWSSADENVATVDEYSGLVTATGVETDTVVITATTNDGGFTDTVTLTVIAAV